MYISRLYIENFRGIRALELNFNEGLNVIIGENNSSKTAVIDALRIILGWGKYDKDIYVREKDFYVDRNNPESEVEDILIQVTFTASTEVAAGFHQLIIADQEENDTVDLVVSIRFELQNKGGVKRVKPTVWGGDRLGQRIDQEIFDYIQTVYLGALRDSQRDLQSPRSNKLADLLEILEPNEDKRQELSEKIYRQLKDSDWRDLVTRAKDLVNRHLEKTSIRGSELEVDLNFLEMEFRGVAEDLRARIPVYKSMGVDDEDQEFFNIYQNGLGDNNRIYIATLLGDLLEKVESNENTYFSLLIEEPEAHLHPQMQNLLFEYFAENIKDNLQVFITSHSPTVTAKAGLNSLIVLQQLDDSISKFETARSTLDNNEKKYLLRFLDVTKSQLFFAKSVIIVEGVSEAILMPTFAKYTEKQLGLEDGRLNLAKNGVEIVVTGGTYFEPFAKLFDNNDNSLQGRCSIATDGDEHLDANGVRSSRAESVKDLENDKVRAFIGVKSLEYELYNNTANSELLDELYGTIRPQTEIKGDSIEEKAISFMKKVSDNSDKGRLSQVLSVRLEQNEENFIVPDYIVDSLKWACSIE